MGIKNKRKDKEFKYFWKEDKLDQCQGQWVSQAAFEKRKGFGESQVSNPTKS